MRLITHLKKTKSTNTYLKELSQSTNVKEGTTIYTDYQSSGRGQRGNSWESEAGRNLLFSTVIYPTFIDANQQFIISQVVALAIKDFLSKRFNDITIKWPNDIYWKDKKLCGILIENEIMGDHISKSIIGVGLNVNQIRFKSDAPNPVSMRQINDGQPINRETTLELIVYYILAYYDEIKTIEGKKRIIEDYKKSLYRNNDYHRYLDETGYFDAIIKDIHSNGLLILKTKEGMEKTYAFKEVKFII